MVTKPRRFPNFIIAGAMKSGTSSVHNILAHHPDVFIPKDEIFFFDIDNFEQHPNFILRDEANWVFPGYDPQSPELLDWYAAFFEDAGDDQVVGEDSTTYFASENVPERIRGLLPEAKIIVMLRDPVARTYSHYWHKVRNGRALFDFDTMLQKQPSALISRSCYRASAARFLEHFDREAIKFIPFERFISDTQGVIDELCDFLGLADSVDVTDLSYRKNTARVPRSLRLKLAANWLNLLKPISRYEGHLPQAPQSTLRRSLLQKAGASAIDLVHDGAMAFPAADYPDMNPQTREFLEDLLGRENDGLQELLGQDLAQYWPWMG